MPGINDIPSPDSTRARTVSELGALQEDLRSKPGPLAEGKGLPAQTMGIVHQDHRKSLEISQTDGPGSGKRMFRRQSQQKFIFEEVLEFEVIAGDGWA